MKRSIILAALALAACTAGCASDGSLTPTGQKIATIGCAIDGVAQPIALPFISAIPTIGGIAATADQAIGHPLVVKACGDLAASIGTSPAAAKPVVLPTS